MRHALILPVHLLDEFGLAAPRESGLPPIHLTLSHLTRDPFPLQREYITYFQNRRDQGDYIIMDNGADESKQGRGDSMYNTLEAARKVRAQEVVLPDVQMDAAATRYASSLALQWLTSYEGKTLYRESGRPRVMIVPQGKSLLEWVECAKVLLSSARETMHKIEGPSLVVGVAKQYHDMFKTHTEGGRQRLVQWLYAQLGEHEEVHLLGYPRGAHDAPELSQKWPGFIRSVDSAKPVVYAMNQIVPGKDYMPDYPKRPKGYFEKGMDTTERDYLEANIKFFCYV